MEKDTKKCPYCGEEILSQAIKCKHCGEFISDNNESDSKDRCPNCGSKLKSNILANCFKIIVYIFCVPFMLCLLLILFVDTSKWESSDNTATIETSKNLKQEQKIKKEQEKQKQKYEQERQKFEKTLNKQQQAIFSEEKPVKKEKLETLKVYSCHESIFEAVCGEVKNNADRSVFFVSVDISLYDHNGNVVSTINDFIDEIRPNQIWRFKALIDTEDAVRYEYNGVSGI